MTSVFRITSVFVLPSCAFLVLLLKKTMDIEKINFIAKVAQTCIGHKTITLVGRTDEDANFPEQNARILCDWNGAPNPPHCNAKIDVINAGSLYCTVGALDFPRMQWSRKKRPETTEDICILPFYTILHLTTDFIVVINPAIALLK